MKLRWFLGPILALTLATPAQAAPRAYDTLVEAYFENLFEANPTQATAAGFHQYDRKFERFTPGAHAQRVRDLNRFLARFQALDPAPLSLNERDDRELVIASIQGALLEEQSIRQWQHNPDRYPSAVTGSIFLLVKRNFASAEERLRSVIAREAQVPAALASARKLLINPPRVYTEVALQQIGGSIDFFKTTVPDAFAGVKDLALLQQFARTNTATIAALESYRTFLSDELLPRSQGVFAIGAENYRRKLAYDELVDVPLDRLLAIGYEQLRKDQQAFREAAKRIDPQATPTAVLATIEADHPAADQLLPAAQKLLNGLRQFLVDKQILTVPGKVQAQVEETPPFLRALTLASMDTPGPYEARATEAFYNITLPDPAWSAERQEDYLRGYNYPLISTVSIHEVWPGHYAQFLSIKNNPQLSKVRKLLAVGSNAEGWAHYTEQMMLDEGYAGDDPKLRLGQLIDALLRDCRYIVGIQMHTQGMSVAEAVEFFVKEGYQTRVNSEVEAKRGTSDPTYLVYTLGKLQIFKLREDYRQKLGDRYRLLDFHDRFIRGGAVPVKLLRRELLGGDSPTL